jgi:uncharacterized damage-inducible protein DinB
MQLRHLIQRVAVMAIIPSALSATQTSPIAGTWTGSIGRSEAQPSSVTMAIKVNPDGSLSGTATGPHLEPGEIRSGWYDAKTGVLKMTVHIKSANSSQSGVVQFEGSMKNDTASGKMLLDGQTGFFKIVKGSVEQASKTQPKMNEGAAEVRRGFVEVSDWLVRAAELVPAEKYSYRPVASVRSFAQQIGHVVDGSRYYCSRASGKAVEWSDITEKSVTQKAALVTALKQAVSDCLAVHDKNGQVGQLMANVAHNNLHYGNLITYIRMLGLVPPSS